MTSQLTIWLNCCIWASGFCSEWLFGRHKHKNKLIDSWKWTDLLVIKNAIDSYLSSSPIIENVHHHHHRLIVVLYVRFLPCCALDLQIDPKQMQVSTKIRMQKTIVDVNVFSPWNFVITLSTRSPVAPSHQWWMVAGSVPIMAAVMCGCVKKQNFGDEGKTSHESRWCKALITSKLRSRLADDMSRWVISYCVCVANQQSNYKISASYFHISSIDV